MILVTLILFNALLVNGAPPSPTSFNVEWTSATKEPGTTQDGLSTYAGTMPLGNGKLTAAAWANVSSGGFSLYIGHQDAMSSHTELFKLARLDVTLTPNPFLSGSYFNQTLDLSSGTVYLSGGGSGMSSAAFSVAIWVDANNDAVYIDVESSAPLSLNASLISVRPSTVWNYSVPFASCAGVSSQPDVFVDPIPPPSPLHHLPPQSASERFRHASGKRRPQRSLGASLLPPLGAFLPDSLIIYHRNQASDGLTLNSTLSQQGLESLVATTPDYWIDNTFGLALDSGNNGVVLQRQSPSLLSSTAPSTSFSLRATALAVQTDFITEWITDLSALVSVAPSHDAARAAHEAWWSSFWARSYIAVNATNSSQWREDAAASRFRETHRGPLAAVGSLPVPGANLWLRASSLSGQSNGSAVSEWADESAAQTPLSQASASLQPIFVQDAFAPGFPSVRFDGVQDFLGSAVAQNAASSTIMAVFRDGGSTGGEKGYICCSGIVFYSSLQGLSTFPASGNGGVADDDDGNAAPGDAIVVMADYSGSGTYAPTNVRERSVYATVRYDNAASSLSIAIDGCIETQDVGTPRGTSGTGLMIGTRNNQYGRYFKGDIAEIVVFPRALNSTELATMDAYFAAQYPFIPPKDKCAQPIGPAYQLSQMYAVTRYTQAIQSRGSLWPIKFNGMAFIAAMDKGQGLADTRSWGPSNWWQNTRLPYGAMLTAGDFDTMRVVLDYYANQEIFLSQRTMAYWNHTGMWTTETHHLSGAYDESDYGCSRDAGYPVQIEQSGYLHLDQGGDSGTGEYSLMALDYFLWTNDTAASLPYLPIAVEAANYFMQHFANRSETGKVVVWPAQVLESYWCDYDVGVGYTNCCADDSPTISGMMTLFAKLLELPPTLTTPAQRAAWQAFTDNLLPPLPLSPDNSTIAPARILSSSTHNNEGPELYAMHPHRVFTVGKQVAQGQDISLGIKTVTSSGFTGENSGWNYGLNAAALVGLTDVAIPLLLARAATQPASGYRFMGFAPHMQDFDPSADHFANMNRCLQEMLLQSGDDGFDETTIVLFPAWDCSWDVDFKLWGPLNTTVEVSYAGGSLLSLTVTPPERQSAVKWANCVANLASS